MSEEISQSNEENIQEDIQEVQTVVEEVVEKSVEQPIEKDMTVNLVETFIHYFQSIPEGEKYRLGKLFNEKTGGKLSQHNNPIPVVVSLIQVEDEGEIKLLGVRRGIPPHVGEIALPGGFQDFMEEPHVSAAREILEETGLQTDVEDYEIYGNPLMSPTNNMLIFFKNKNVFPSSILEELKLNSEVLEFVLVDENTPLCFPLHEKKAKEYFASRPASENKGNYRKKEFKKFG